MTKPASATNQRGSKAFFSLNSFFGNIFDLLPQLYFLNSILFVGFLWIDRLSAIQPKKNAISSNGRLIRRVHGL
jgi:hypothetical protein